MILYERDSYLKQLNTYFDELQNEIGQTIIVNGEAGLGKTVLIESFYNNIANRCYFFTGSCDSLFTPRPLGPLFDIASDIGGSFKNLLYSGSDRNLIFSSLLDKLKTLDKPCVLVIEDIHWADESTADFIKFLSRRISNSNCLLILTARENEIRLNEAIKLIISEIPSNHLQKLKLVNLSKQAVLEMVSNIEISGRDLFNITKGHPFFVTEIINSNNNDIPESIADVIITSLNKLKDNEKELTELISIFPNRVEAELILKLKPESINYLENILKSGILVEDGNYLRFKHEISRLVVAESISTLKKTYLHNEILKQLQNNNSSDLALMVHHARNANKPEIVAELAPKAGDNASNWGAHLEASKLYKMAIDCTSEMEDNQWGKLLEKYSIECYLTNQLGEAISIRDKITKVLESSNDILSRGDNYRWLSRMHWYNGNNQKAFNYAKLSIEQLETLKEQTEELALAYTNFGQLFMLKNDFANTVLWCEKAIEIAKAFNRDDIIAHAMTNIGSIQLNRKNTEHEGIHILHEALELARKCNNQDHIIRIMTSLICHYILKRQFKELEDVLSKGIEFCENHEINSYLFYLKGWDARQNEMLGNWDKALQLSNTVLKVKNQASINRIVSLVPKARIKMRRRQKDEAKLLLTEVAKLALDTREAQRLLPVACAMLEYQWIYNEIFEDQSVIEFYSEMTENGYYVTELVSEYAFWLTLNNHSFSKEWYLSPEYNKLLIDGNNNEVVQFMLDKNCNYDAAIMLSMGDESDLRKSIQLLDVLGASATIDKIRGLMKSKGLKNIPVGIRKSTKSNPAMLTNRQIDVLRELGNGLQNTEIANKLFISSKTVEHHISSIFVKLDVNSRSKAVIKAKELDILD